MHFHLCYTTCIEAEDSLWKSVLFRQVDPGDWTQVVRFGSRPLYPLTILPAHPALFFSDNLSLNLELIDLLAVLANRLEESACLCLLRAGVIDRCLFLPGIQPGPYAYAINTLLFELSPQPEIARSPWSYPFLFTKQCLSPNMTAKATGFVLLLMKSFA